jgi:16S rRNA (cytosine1402-N4)-methyltransferase
LQTEKQAHHEPVLLKEVLEGLDVKEGGVYVDGTVGLAGHSLAILERSSPTGFLYGFEWNEETYDIALERLKPYEGRFKLYKENFAKIPEILSQEGVLADGVLLDLGVSSFLLEGVGRGFSFKRDEPLDMRMSQTLEITASDVLNRFSLPELAKVFEEGEVPKAFSLAKFICEQRKRAPFTRTVDLVQAVKAFYKGRRDLNDLLAVVFQSLRIRVNKELENLEIALKGIPSILKKGGRFAVISFHSLEDRLVKLSFRSDPRLKALTKKPITPSPEEVRRNPRARSAKLRIAERV